MKIKYGEYCGHLTLIHTIHLQKTVQFFLFGYIERKNGTPTHYINKGKSQVLK